MTETLATKRVWRQQLDAAMVEAQASCEQGASTTLVALTAFHKAKAVLEGYGHDASSLKIQWDEWREPSLYWTLGADVVKALNALEDQALKESGDKDASHRLGLKPGEAFERVWISLKVAEVSGWRSLLQNRLVPCYRSCKEQKVESALLPQALANSIKDLMEAAGVERFDIWVEPHGESVWLTLPVGSTAKLVQAFDVPESPQAEVWKPKYYVLEDLGPETTHPPKKEYETISIPYAKEPPAVGWRKDLQDRLVSANLAAGCTFVRLDRSIADIMARVNVTNYQVRLDFNNGSYLVDCPAGTEAALDASDIKGYRVETVVLDEVIDLKANIGPNFTQELSEREVARSWLHDFVGPYVDPNFTREALTEKVEQSKQTLRVCTRRLQDRQATAKFVQQEAARKEAQRAALAALRDDWDNLPDADEPGTSIIPRPKVNK